MDGSSWLTWAWRRKVGVWAQRDVVQLREWLCREPPFRLVSIIAGRANEWTAKTVVIQRNTPEIHSLTLAAMRTRWLRWIAQTNPSLFTPAWSRSFAALLNNTCPKLRDATVPWLKQFCVSQLV